MRTDCFVKAPRSQSLMHAIAWRLAAIVPFAVAVGANLAYTVVSKGGGAGVTTLAKIGFSLVALSAAWVGVLLLIHGKRLFRPRRIVQHCTVIRDPQRDISSAMFADRHAMAHMLTAQAVARVAQRSEASKATRAKRSPYPTRSGLFTDSRR